MQKSELPSNDDDIAKWESEFSQLMNAQRDELDYGESMQNAWESGIGDFQEGSSAEKPLLFDAEGVPQLGEYVFGTTSISCLLSAFNASRFSEKTNPYMDAPSRSLLADAKALLEQNGSLSEAALMLEAAIQKDDLGEGGFEAWILLGETRNMDEREDAGMKALLEGVKRAELRGTSGEGMLVGLNYAFPFTASDLTQYFSPWPFHLPMNHSTGGPMPCSFVGFAHDTLPILSLGKPSRPCPQTPHGTPTVVLPMYS